MEEKKKILFVCDYFYPMTTSIGLCVGKLVDEAVSREYETDVLCFKTSNLRQGGREYHIYYVKRRLGYALKDYAQTNTKSRLGKLAGVVGNIMIRLKQIIFFHWFRMGSVIGPLRFYYKIKKLYKENRYDVVVCSHAPFDGVLGTYWFKRKNPDVKVVLYVLDSLTNKGNTKWISSKTNDRKGWKWEQKFYKNFEKIINIKCNEEHNEKKRYDKYREKMFISDIPLMAFNREWRKIKPYDFGDNCIHIIYGGRLLSHLSSPDYLCKVVMEASKMIHVKMHFFSSGDCEKKITQYVRETNMDISYEGMVNHDKLLSYYFGSTALVSIGSQRPDMLPSKIFEYISTGKKIIHVIKGDNDVCVEHYKKYPQILFIDEREDIKKNAGLLCAFLKSPEVQIDIKELERKYKINTPAYTMDIIEKGMLK